MNRTRNATHALTAADVMSRVLVTVHHRMTLRAAARALAWWGGDVLPVTDDQDRSPKHFHAEVGAVFRAQAVHERLGVAQKPERMPDDG